VSKKTITTCDECGVERKDVNRWFSMIGQLNHPAFYTFHDADMCLPPAKDEIRLDYCGQQCAGAAFHRWLDTGTVEKPQPTAVYLPEVDNG
jgi:hypothetical protein